MKSDLEDLAVLIGSAVFIAATCIGAYYYGAYSCQSKWQQSGFQTSYGVFQGCRISRDGKVWIPAENYREIP